MLHHNVLVVSNRKRTADILVKQLKEFLKPEISVEGRSLEGGLGTIHEDSLVVAATPLATANLTNWITRSTPIVTAVRTMRRDKWEIIMGLPPKTGVLVVNDGQDTAVDTVALLKDLGLVHVSLVPWYPELKGFPCWPLAVTPGEPQLVPDCVKRTVDMGDRVLDPATLIEVLAFVGELDLKNYQRILDYCEKVMMRPGSRKVLQLLAALREDLESVLDSIHEGILVVDEEGIFRLANKPLEDMLGKKLCQLTGKTLKEISRTAGIDFRFWPGSESGPEVLHTGKQQVVVTASARGMGKGTVYTLREANALKESDNRLRQELRVKGFNARYRFEDITGQSKLLNETVQRAKKFALKSASILITGESGTGKELFAQAIHNSSSRAKYPFVAVNCAAIPENLLESELFGYEGGAFTGARPNGKEGLFEQAHLGTIFLDEIGELSFGLQSRLLRVLQEREVMRIGASRVRPIDVRVVAATNQDLEQAIRTGRFRPDLYYRLAVLPLYIPPLRERGEDVSALAAKFLQELGSSLAVPEAILNILKEHNWPGNVRELRNCIEYMVASVEEEFCLSNLPPSLLPRSRSLELAPTREHLRHPENLPGFVLQTLAQGHSGRRSLTQQAQEAGYLTSEGQMRNIMAELAFRGLVKFGRGRAGTCITQAGLDFVNQLHN